jgi:SSS family transporter
MTTLDLVLVAAYLFGVTLFGLRFRKRERTLRDYFLADRDIPWWAISLSIIATETSTLTIISIPGLAYDQDFRFLQVAMGYMLGRVVISAVLLPQYFRGELFTAYELIERRFGPRLRSLTAGVFLMTRAAADGVRVWAIAIVVGIGLFRYLEDLPPGMRDILAVTIVLVLTLIYTYEGGLRAVIWTDVLQTIVYLGGALAGFFVLVQAIPGGLGAIADAGSAANKFRMFDFSSDLTTVYTFWGGLIGGAFLTTASHGTDQMMVQRLLAARTQRESRTALLASGVAIFLQFALFLALGVALFAYYRVFPPQAPFTRADAVFPTFIVHHMPPGMAGLMIAAILAAAMSTLSSSLNSLASTSVMDFYLRKRPDASDRQRMLVSRASTLVWAVVLFALALAARGGGRVLELGLSIASVAYGAMLGVFLLGTLTEGANERGAMVGMLAGLTVSVHVWRGTSIGWTWYVFIGTAATFAIGYIASTLFARRND